ncbi:hypothetical protein SteCoe_11298 [Stentor coeruleus]|uniref:Uncharacterized protein n=1 Tax=Stentor coeruleus TaxID=5963 RepID=A0A1R2CDG4_9CILI|nr:hypothetical protein SteCoe_11298 [Stentor coeruleus]
MGSKKSHFYLARLFRHTPRKSYIQMLIYLVLNLISSYLYHLSLEGGDVDYLASQAGYFSALIISSTILNIIVMALNFYTCTGWVKIMNFLLQVIILVLTLTQDLGTDLMNHGQYNLLVLIFILIPIILGFVIYKVCRFVKSMIQSWLKFILINVGIIVAGLVYVKFAIYYAEIGWYQGLGNTVLTAEWPMCTIENPGLPWPSMLPHRTLNFFTGSNSCSYRWDYSSLSENILQLKCPSEVTITEQPDYISMRNDMFVLTETGFEVYNDTKSLEKTYKVQGNSQLKISSEWFHASCEGYENYYIQNVRNDTVYKRLKSQNEKRSVKPMNLILFMMDTVSRQQFFRKMKEMSEYLEHLNSTGKYEVYQFFRIISNGFNTEYNTRAMYSGSQLRQDRRGRPYWDFFSGQGNVAAYINGFCEDWMSVFMKTKFKGMDHKVFYPWCHPEFHPYEKTFGNFAGPFSIVRRCINGKHVHSYIFEYIKEMWKNYTPYGKIVHVSFQEGHEGTGEVLRTLSPSMQEFFSLMENQNELENTVVILTSDHGSHMGPYFMSGEMGKFEQKLPLLIMMYPKWFIDKYPEFRKNLQENEQRLVSHYDTYWTLRHLATLKEFGGEIEENKQQESWHEEVWDCKKYKNYMEIAENFKYKSWRKGMKNLFIDILYERISQCFEYLQYTPEDRENITTVPLSSIRDYDDENGYYVGEVIKDLDAYYWFEDAYQDVNKNYLINGNGNRLTNYTEFIEEIKIKELKAWDEAKAPGQGRYLFGRSLLRYHDDRDCQESGIVNCVCKERDSIHDEFSKIG